MAKKRKRTKHLSVDTVRARNIYLVDEKNVVRASLTSSSETVQLYLCDEKGQPRIWLSLDPHGEPHIMLTGANGHPAVGLGARNDGFAGMSIYNVNAPSEAIRIGIQDLGDPNVVSTPEPRIIITGKVAPDRVAVRFIAPMPPGSSHGSVPQKPAFPAGDQGAGVSVR